VCERRRLDQQHRSIQSINPEHQSINRDSSSR
jgi:hypothetical protein